ncbi:MAG: aspartate kinase [Methanomassiliicoccales archaeon]|jgi:aspartate kinase
MIKVMKFGGTSVGSGEAMDRTSDIIRREPAQKAVVVSAMSGVTNTLIAAMNDTQTEPRGVVDKLREKHMQAATGKMDQDNMDTFRIRLDDRLEKLHDLLEYYHKKEDRIMIQDAIQSWGERLSSLTLTYILRSKDVEAVPMLSEEAGIVATGMPGNGTADLVATSKNLKATIGPMMKDGWVPIITGFYGCERLGRPLTFGRGGSDYSGSVVAYALDADVLEIWTDVTGFMSADPRIVPNAKTIHDMDYGEAAELAYFGAKVLHPRTIEPAKRKNIPVWVKNTFKPDAYGTKIFSMKATGTTLLRSVAMKTDLAVVKFYSSEIAYQPSVLTKILESVNANGVSTYAVSTSLSTLAVALPSSSIAEVMERVSSIKEDIESVTVKEDMALICAVGDSMLENTGVAAKVFSVVAEVGANVEMISEGASDVALNFVVPSSRAIDVIRKLHERYIG